METDGAGGAYGQEDPGYLDLFERGLLEWRVERLEKLLAPCRVCPRRCGVDRRGGRIGACFSAWRPVVSSYCDHHGEEPPISGRSGSGTIFFANCNLRCVYCQNHQISQRFDRTCSGEVAPARLAEMMLELQAAGCHNINFVSPTHFAPQMARALWSAAGQGLRLPIVYNSNGYESGEVLQLLEGVVDIYMPDLKYGDGDHARRYSHVRGYPDHARMALAEMWRQVGPLQRDARGVARRGMLVRHLVLPNGLADSEQVMETLAEICGTDPGPAISLMAQYWPAHRADRYPLLARRIHAGEYRRAVERAVGLGFEDLLIQDRLLAPESYQPDFDRDHPFER